MMRILALAIAMLLLFPGRIGGEDAPEAPEGSVFAGWFTGDGVQLFTDEEEICHAVTEAPFLNILARFAALQCDIRRLTRDRDKRIHTRYTQ